MAIDTKTKRLSMLNVPGVPQRMLPEPDGSYDAGDRLTFLGLYSGITPAAPTAAVGRLLKTNDIGAQLFNGLIG